IFNCLSAVLPAVNSGSYMLGAYFNSATSNRSKCFSTLLTKLFQFFFSLGDHTDSAMAIPLGQVMYSACLRLYTCSVHKFACPPLMYFGSTPSGTGSN